MRLAQLGSEPDIGVRRKIDPESRLETTISMVDTRRGSRQLPGRGSLQDPHLLAGDHRLPPPAHQAPGMGSHKGSTHRGQLYDWTTYTLLFSVMVWPPVDVSEAQADTLEKVEYFQQHRVQDVMRCISKGAGGMGWSLLFETEERLIWDRRREVWVTEDGHAFEYPEMGV
jgi:hypothetical protein